MASLMPVTSDQKPVKCGICLEPLHNPRDLSCLHSFCVECLEGWMKKSDKDGVLSCPTCMEETPVPKEGVQELPQSEKGKKGSVVCGNCDNPEKPVTVHCLDCKESMCQTCCLSHQKIKALQDHQVMPIEDVESGKTKKLSDKKYCTKHEGEPNKFYCQTCEKLVCRDCIVMKQCCRDHDYVTMQEAAEKQAGNVKKALELCTKAEVQIQRKIEETVKIEANLRRLLIEVQNVHQVGSGLSESNSYFEIVSKYEEMKQVLDEVDDHGIYTDSETSQSPTLPNPALVEENIPYSPQSQTVSNGISSGLKDQWRQFGQIKGDSYNEMKGISITSSNDIALFIDGHTNNIHGPTVCVKSRSGDQKHQFQTPDGRCIASPTHEMQRNAQEFGSGNKGPQFSRPVSNLKNPASVPLSPHASSLQPVLHSQPHHTLTNIRRMPPRSMGQVVRQQGPTLVSQAVGQQGPHGPIYSTNPTVDMCVIPSAAQSRPQQSKCTIYETTKGKEVSSFNMPDKDPKCVTLDNSGNIIIGYSSDLISIHHNNGSIISQFKANSRTYPIGIAATGKDEIAAIFKNTAPFIRILNYSGQIVKNCSPPPGDMVCRPISICSSELNELFVLNQGETDAVYIYTGDGDYVGCVTTGIDHAVAIALSPDDQELFVAEYQRDKISQVKIFQRP